MRIFLKMILKGLKRRKKEMRYVSIVTFTAALFVSSITLFQRVMDRYVMETNYQNYGDWVLAAVKDDKNPAVSFSKLEHPYLNGYGICRTGGMLLNEQAESSGVNLGTVDKAVREFGNICLYEGRFPETEHEIVMDLSSLFVLGYSYDLGQTIRAAVQTEAGVLEKEFCLTGTMKSFAENWKHAEGYPLPNAVVTEKGLAEMGGALYETHFYRLDRKYEDVEMNAFLSAFMTPQNVRVYNSYVYENRVWGSQNMFRAAEALLVLVGALAVGYLMLSYVSQRRKWYAQLRCIGADKKQIRMMILAEAVYGMVPYVVLAMALSYFAAAAICAAVAAGYKMPSFFVMRPQMIVGQFGVFLGVIGFVVLCAWFGSRDKRLEVNKAEITKRQLKRLRKDAGKSRNTGRIFLRRQRKLYPFQKMLSVVFSVGVCCVLLLCFGKIYQASVEYQAVQKSVHDFEAGKRKKMKVRTTWENGEYGESENLAYDMYEGLSKKTEEEIQSLIGVAQTGWQIWDNTHILQWEGMENSPVEQSRNAQYENHSADGVFTTEFHYYASGSKIIKALKKEYGLTGLDWKAFEAGEQVLLILFEYDVFAEGKKISETTLHAGDRVKIVSAEAGKSMPMELEGYDLQGCVSTEIGAVITNPSFEWKALFGYLPVYGVIASENLAKRVAFGDGREIKRNKAEIDLNRNQSFESTQKRLASVFEKNGMEYRSGTEELWEARARFIRELCIYGSILCMALALFFLLWLHFCQIQNQYQAKEYRLLRQLGMDHTYFRRMKRREGIGQALWMALGIPCSYVVRIVQVYTANKQIKETVGLQIWSESLGDYTSDLYYVTFDQICRTTNFWYVLLFTGALMAGIVGIFCLSGKKEARQEAEFWDSRESTDQG